MIDDKTFQDVLSLQLSREPPPGSNLLVLDCGTIDASVKAVWEKRNEVGKERIIVKQKEMAERKGAKIATIDCGTDPIPWHPEITTVIFIWTYLFYHRTNIGRTFSICSEKPRLIIMVCIICVFLERGHEIFSESR